MKSFFADQTITLASVARRATHDGIFSDCHEKGELRVSILAERRFSHNIARSQKQFDESAKPEQVIKANLRGLGYGG